MDQICNKSRFWTKIFENLDFCRNFRQILILVEIFEYLDFGRNLRKIPILVEILKNLDYGRNFWKISIFQTNLDFGRNFQTSRLLSKFAKNLDFGWNFRKISIFVEIFQKSRFLSKFLKNREFGRYFRKLPILVTIENFIQQINPIISKLSKENSHAIFTGDFNINLLEMNTRIKYQAYFDQFVTNDFYPKIVQPCRFTKKTGSVIDHTFCKLSENTSKSHSGILISNMSEHLQHFTCLDILSNQQKPPKYIIKEKHDEASLLSFYNEIESSLRNAHFPNELTTDPNVTYDL